jgi:hypothetical protein
MQTVNGKDLPMLEVESILLSVVWEENNPIDIMALTKQLLTTIRETYTESAVVATISGMSGTMLITIRENGTIQELPIRLNL